MWYLSPIIYSGFVKASTYIVLPNIEIIRKINNVLLSIFSGGLCLLTAREIYVQTDNYSVTDMVCKVYINTTTMNIIINCFYLSKYWEWLDSYFIIANGRKKITNLHYYHHMITPSLSYINTMYDGIVPSFIYACLLNTFVHTFMYWYYAFPNSKLRRYKKFITTGQIIQHTYMLLSIFYIIHSCYDEKIMIQSTASLISYSFFFSMFMKFYLTTYLVKID